MEVKGRKVDGFDGLKQAGDFYWSASPPGRLTFLCPCGCGDVGGILVAGDESRQPVWQWNGNEEAPTVTPSIRFMSGCQWHGYLTAGVFRSC